MNKATQYFARNVLHRGYELWDKYKHHESPEVRRLALRVKAQALILHERILYLEERDMNDQRRNQAMRERIEQYLNNGWSLTGRNPVRIERGRAAKQVRGDMIIDV
jgi:hypothetical protein